MADYVLAASIGSWAVLGLTVTEPASITRWGMSVLHVTVAVAIAIRAPVERVGSPGAVAAALPSLVVAGLAFGGAAPAHTWPAAVEVVFLSGASLTIYSFVVLGSSFAILPARRGERRPRSLSNPSISRVALLMAALPMIALRIRAEEELLSSSERYRRYRSRVRARVIPGVW